MSLDPTIRAYYEDRREADRLLRGPCQLEYVRTRQLIERHLAGATGTMIDVGGAAGVYALWLAERGHRVHLLDPVDRLVAEALQRDRDAGGLLASCQAGEARQLPFDDESADVVLLLGPLYHLTAAVDRRAALAEAYRVLRPGGLLFAAAISRWASALDALAQDYFARPGRAAVVDRAVLEGQHRNTDGAGGFTTAYFHRPDDLRREVAVDFTVEGVYAVEGVAGFFPDFDARWDDPRQRADILRMAEALESEEHLLGATPHLLAVGRK